MNRKNRTLVKQGRRLVLVLREESYRLVASAAKARGQAPEQFALEALRHHCREAFDYLTLDIAEAGSSRLPRSRRDAAQGQASILEATRPTTDRVLQAIAQVYGVPVEALASRRRSRQVSATRWAAMYLLSNDVDLSLEEIARLTRRAPGEVHYAIRQFESRLETAVLTRTPSSAAALISATVVHQVCRTRLAAGHLSPRATCPCLPAIAARQD
jgi:hypothetical protein